MKIADHIHLRCPGNMGLIGALIQVFFPNKKKTAKYAGNWDPKSKQPLSYRLQKAIISSTTLSKNMTVLVYGNWLNQSTNIKSFFTATYFENEKLEVVKPPLEEGIKMAYVGTLSRGKNPIQSLEVFTYLINMGLNAELIICGDGILKDQLERKIANAGLTCCTKVLGNVDSHKIKEVLMQSHFLIFLSDSEGWPKAVAESMWWGCIPITKPVSCVQWMLGNGVRGGLTDGKVDSVANYIIRLLKHPKEYEEIKQEAMAWSRQYTLNKFEQEIQYLC